MKTTTGTTMETYPVTFATDEARCPQVTEYPEEMRAEQRDHLGVLVAAHTKAQDTKSERVRAEQLAVIAREFAYFEQWRVGLAPEYGDWQNKERLTGYSLRQTKAEVREWSGVELDWLVKDAEDALARSRKSLMRRLESLWCGVTDQLVELSKNPQALVNSSGIVQSQGAEIDQLCAKIDAQEKAVAAAHRMAKLARRMETGQE